MSDDLGWPNPPQATPLANVGSTAIPVNGEIVSDPTTPKASQRLRLSTVSDCKREIRRLYIDARNNEISSSEASKFVWIISTLSNLIADAELEQRVERLESQRD